METLFFLVSKTLWFVVAPENLLVLTVSAAWIFLLRNSIRLARASLGFAAISMIILALVPVGEWLLHPLEMRFDANPSLPQQVDGIIVLGGAEDALTSASWDQVEVNGSAERFMASVALARRYPNAKLVFASGSGSVMGQKLKGATVARKFYEEQGIDLTRVLLENQSRNTVENATFSKALVKPASGENWVLVTSAFHMPRSMGIFCKIGWAAIPYPVDHRTRREGAFHVSPGILGNLDTFSIGVKEWIGLSAYFATGKTAALVPGTCKA